MSGIEAAFFGGLGRDAEQKVSKSGKPYLRMNVRVDSGDTAQWVSVFAFDPEAIEIADRFVKSARVYCEGSLTTSGWIGQDGQKRLGLSVMSWHCRLSRIGINKVKRERKKPAVAAADTFYDDAIPFAPEVR